MAFLMGGDSRYLLLEMTPEELYALRAYCDTTDTSADLEKATLDMSGVAEPTVDVTSRPVDVGAVICGALNDVMVGLGFAAAQVGSDSDGAVSAIFCANNNRLLAVYPGLPVPVYPDSGACTDFTVETSAGSDPRVVAARLEGEGIDRLVVAIGRSDLLPAANAVRGMPLEKALSEVVVLVREVFATAARPY
jgi:hypothetical protein